MVAKTIAKRAYGGDRVGYGFVVLGLVLCGCANSETYKGEYERDRFFEHLESIPVQDVQLEGSSLIQCDGVSHDLAEVLARIGGVVRTLILREYPPSHWMRHDRTVAHLLEARSVDWIARVSIAVEGNIKAQDAIVLSYFDTYPDHPSVDNVVGSRSGVDIVVVPCRWEVVDIYDWDVAGEE